MKNKNLKKDHHHPIRPFWAAKYLLVLACMGLFIPKIANGQQAQKTPSSLTDFDSSDVETRKQAIQNAVATHNVRAMKQIASLAKSDPDPSVRIVAAWAIGAMDLKMRQQLLEAILANDSSQAVRIQAKDSLQKLSAGPPQSSPFISGCNKDTDCKGPRICTAPPKIATGWARKAGLYGIGASGVSLGLSLFSAYNRKDMTLAIPLAASATVISITSAVIITAGSKSAKSHPDVNGSLALRLMGWLSMGFHITGTVALATAIPFHWIKRDEEGFGWYPPVSWLLINGALGVSGLLALSFEAIASHKQVMQIKQKQLKKRHTPFVAPTIKKQKISGVTAGYAILF